MATINEIANIDSYTGNANLGGYSPNAIQLDTRPIQQLAAYTFMYNKSQYDQRQKDADEKIAELAKLTAFDAMNALPEDLEKMKEAKLKLDEVGSKFSSETYGSPKQKQEGWLKFQRDKADAEKLLNLINSRNIKLTAYIDATTKDGTISEEKKALMIKDAKELFVNNPDKVPQIPNYKETIPTVGETVMETVQSFKEDANGNLIVDETRNEYSYTGNAKMGYLEANDLEIPTLSANATPQQKAEFERKRLNFSESRLGGWKNAAEFGAAAFNDPNYKKQIYSSDPNFVGPVDPSKPTEEVDIEKIKASNPILGGLGQLSEAYNTALKAKIARLEDQQYQSSITGKKPLFSQGQDTPESLKKLIIDPTKPLSSEQLTQLARFEKARPDKVEMKIIKTDDARQDATLAETIRNNKADQYLKGKEIKLNEDKWKAAQTGGSTQINGAMERAKRIYKDLVSIAGTDGIIEPNDIRKLNVEQLKYLGIENVETSETGVPRTVFKPLNLTVDEKGKSTYMIQLVNGQVKVMRDATLRDDGKGYHGYWDNTKSTNLFNIGTNILNEELKNSGAKELNAYMGIDVTGGITSNTDGGSTSQSGSTSQYTNITDTNKGQIGVKNGKWYDIKTGKPIE